MVGIGDCCTAPGRSWRWLFPAASVRNGNRRHARRDADCASHRKPRVAVDIGGSFSWHHGKPGEVEFRCRYPPVPRTLVGSGPCTPGHRALPVLHAHRRFAWTNDGWLLQIFWNPLNAVPHHRDSSQRRRVELANEALLVCRGQRRDHTRASLMVTLRLDVGVCHTVGYHRCIVDPSCLRATQHELPSVDSGLI